MPELPPAPPPRLEEPEGLRGELTEFELTGAALKLNMDEPSQPLTISVEASEAHALNFTRTP